MVFDEVIFDEVIFDEMIFDELIFDEVIFDEMNKFPFASCLLGFSALLQIQ